MCLVIKEAVNKRIVKCYKKLRLHTIGESYTTPFYCELIPEDGILIPRRDSERKTYKIGNKIHGGFIHAYSEKISIFVDNEYLFKAYAFGVKAYGFRDLVCRGLYIPDLDNTRSQRETRKVEKRLKEASIKELVEMFPRLRRVAKLL